ncbi:MAG TPA: DNA polymerase III subunit beta [Candidatus Absconditabacterales bacterium]|nr:DNA polymerase III subunit beta [Candidatus Absconditabacterales bacterium]
MKVTLQVAQLNDILDLVSRFVSKHSTLQILENIYIKGTMDSLIFRATDMEKFVEIEIPGKVSNEGAITVNARTFTDIIKSIDEKEVELNIDSAKETMSIKSPSDSFKIKGISANEYVALPEVVKVHSLSLESKLFSQGVEKVEYAVTEKNFSPVLTGVLIKIKKDSKTNNLIFVGTDSFRLAEYKIPYEGSSPEMSLIIPKTNINEIKKLADYAISHKAESMEITMSENLVSFVFNVENMRIMATSLLIQGNFPEYDNENIMPTQHNTKIIVDKDQLDKSIKKISILTKDINNYIALQGQQDKLFVTSGDTDKGDAKTEISSVFEGQEVAFGLNGRYVSDFIRSIGSSELVMGIVASDKPIIFTDKDDSHYKYVVRPLVK